ncbi:unnamed protein product [Durusdinium trenchii]|uniref:Uncharacterized protein n=2 Tax=Durusdinium trenchii TaxID=1381693 RepID=A0ABP0RB30_9DINO
MGPQQDQGQPCRRGCFPRRAPRSAGQVCVVVLVVCFTRCLAFLAAQSRSLTAVRPLTAQARPRTSSAAAPSPETSSTGEGGEPSEMEEDARQRVSAERVAALKDAINEGDLGKILEALGIPIWLLPAIEVVIGVLELGLIYAGIKLLPPETFGFLPEGVRSLLQIGVTDA